MSAKLIGDIASGVVIPISAARTNVSPQRTATRQAALTASAIPLPADVQRRIASKRYEQTRAVIAAEKLIASNGAARILVLTGDVGTGKTFAAACAAASVAPGSASYVEAIALPRVAFPGLRETAPTFRGHGLWVLDDLGTEATNDRFAEALFVFINARHAYGKTIITTNVRAADMRKRYSARVIDRLRSAAVVVECRGASMREDIGGGL